MGLILFLIFLHFHLLHALPQPDVAPVQPFLPTQTPPATIQAFPEQSDLATDCPLHLPDELFHRISNACGGKARSGQLRRSQCCPILAAWIYAAYSSTALGSTSRMSGAAGAGAGAASSSSPYDLPVLPDDSETCVENLEKSLKQKGVELRKPNETCDVVYCYCGIRLHPLSCPEAFSVGKEGKLDGDENVKKLERDCLQHHNNQSYSSLSGCSKCLKTLYKLKGTTNNNTTSAAAAAAADRKTKMRNRDCELMGLTWLLSKNRTAYMPTVSAVLRAIMMNTDDDSNPRSCSLASDGMPLAVDSDEIDDQSSTNKVVESPIHLIFSMAVCLMVYVCGMVVLK